MDKVLVVSNHGKNSLVNTTTQAVNQQTGESINYSVDVPVEVVWENTVRAEPQPINEMQLKHVFNFLAVSQISPRKNFDNIVPTVVQ